MDEELERLHKIRDSLEVKLQSLNQRLSTVESFRDYMYSDNSNLDQYEYQISRKLQEAHARIKDLEDEITEQENVYISEVVIDAEAQAFQYQQKSLEEMISLMKTDSSKSSLVQQMNTEKDQEVSLVKTRLQELESVASSRQKEVILIYN
ncbi:hypothetical protein L2E82_18656 [Cichorium intybus]|uniref:Uncharacterized protein n=1 Tax=Cichorium intybus TaxID=13427 RepID=A0ACB9FA50_CICIN|nr:hypothetical protein L2E82_18656 [Cichorium intybus]